MVSRIFDAHDPSPRGDNPFDHAGVERRSDGTAVYSSLPRSLVHMLDATVRRSPDARAVTEVDGASLSYRELWDRAAAVAGGLRREGVTRGDRVASMLPNSIDWVVAFWATQFAGAILVPINTRFSQAEAQYVAADCQAHHVLRPGDELPTGTPFVCDGLDRDDLAAFFYTSGTTGFPKGAMATHANLLSSIENAKRVVGLRSSDAESPSTIINVPLFHVTGCNTQMLLAAELGSQAFIMANTLDFPTYLELIESKRIPMLTSVPAFFWALMRQRQFEGADVSAVRYISYGGAPVATDMVRHIKKAFPGARVGNGFGLTECSAVAAYLPHEDSEAYADSVGYAAPVVDLAIDRPHLDTGVGELLIRGQNVVRGYWNKPEASRETFQNGWLHTGDLGRIDADGRLYIVDRAKDMINRGGENVYSIEVESALIGAPGVYEAAVLPVPDEMMGEKVGAVLVPAGATIDVSAVIAHLGAHVADFKVPQFVVVRREPLPRNAGGKVLKAHLAKTVRWGKPLP